MIVTYKDDVSTLDPAIGYDWQNWSMIKSLFDGLMDYKPGTTELVPGPRRELRDLARRHDLHLQAAPRRQVPQRPRADRRRREVLDRARASTRRRRAPAPASSARSRAIDECRRQADELSGITVVDPTPSSSSCRGPTPPSCTSWRSTSPTSCRRRRSRSTAPTSASIRSAPAPSSSTEWTLGQRLVFERNPDYWQQGRAASRQDHLRGRPGADRGAAAPAAGRGRHPRRRHPAGQVPGGDGRSRQKAR